jgi:hypothetical protein
MIKLLTRVGLPVLAAAALGVTVGAAPASASDTFYAECSAGGGYRLDATAFGLTGFTWSGVNYELSGGGDQSNMNISLYNEDNDLLWSWNSPDNREPGILYTKEIRRANGGLIPARHGDRVDFTAIFDRPIWSDPRCTATAIVD